MTQRLDFYAANPAAIKAMGALEQQIAKSSLEKPLTEIVRLRASQINGCAYCVDKHSADAKSGGDTDRKINGVVVWRETPFFTERERAALEWTESLTLISETHAPDETYERVKAHFSEAELVDLTLLIVAINGWNRFGISFRKLPE